MIFLKSHFLRALFLVGLFLLSSIHAHAQGGITGVIPTDPTLDRVNWAESLYGATISGTPGDSNGFTINKLIDGKGTDYNQYIGFAANSAITIDLGQIRYIRALQLHFYDGDPHNSDGVDRFFRYKVEYSVDGTIYKPLIDKTAGEHRGVQFDAVEPSNMRYVKITPTFASNNGNIYFVDEIHVLGDETIVPQIEQQVNIDGRVNGGTVDAGKMVELAAGIYEVKYDSGAVSFWANDSDNGGKTYLGMFNLSVPGANKIYRFGNIHPKLSNYATSLEAENASKGKSIAIWIPNRTNVSFWVEGSAATNRGAVQLKVKRLSGANDSILARVRDAMTRSVLWEQIEVANWSGWVSDTASRNCFGCHIQTQASAGLNESKRKLPDLPVNERLEAEFVDAYQKWQNIAGWVSPFHGGSLAITQTSLWAWAVSTYDGSSFSSLGAPFISALSYLLRNQQAAGGWANDHDAPALYGDGNPSAAHTAGNMQAISKALNQFETGTFVPFSDVVISGGEITLNSNIANFHDIKFSNVDGITGVRIRIEDSFASNKNFVLNEFESFSEDIKQSVSEAEASRNQANFPISKTINNIKTDANDGWAIDGNVDSNPATGLWKFSSPVSLDRIRLTLIYPSHQFKKYLIEVTTDPTPTLTSTFVPVSIEAVGNYVGEADGPLAQMRVALKKAASLFSGAWNFQRNHRTAAHTIIGLYYSLPHLTGTDASDALARINEIGAFLRANQRADGGWCESGNTNCPSRSYVSAIVLRALLLIADSDLDQGVINASNYLLYSQDTDGAWTSRPLARRLAATTWVEIALPTLYERLTEQYLRSNIDDLIAIGGLGQVELSWSPIPDARSYNIYRRSSDTAWRKIASNHITDVANFIDTNVVNEVTYEYYVRWVDKDGVESADSNQASGTPFGLQCGRDSPPSIVSRPITGATEGQTYRYQVEATDPDEGDVLTYSLPSAPTGMTIDSSTGLISWNPSESDIGSYFVRVTVKDRIQRYATQSYRINVAKIYINKPPKFVSTPITSGTVGYKYRYNARALDPNIGDILGYTLPSSPNGMSINSSVGTINWTPLNTQTGDNSVSVRVSDVAGLSDFQDYSLSISANQPPVFTSSPILRGYRGRAYIYEATATDPESGALRFSFITRPSGMTIDTATGRVFWIPTSTQIGVHEVKIKVTDPGALFAEQVFLVTVPANDPPIIVSAPNTRVGVNSNYQYQVRVTDTESDPISYALTEAPSGMTISSSGLIRWISGEQAQVPITVSVTDGFNEAVTQSFVLQVSGSGGSENGSFNAEVITPEPGSVIKTRSNVFGSITGSGSFTWRAVLKRENQNDGIEIGNGSGSVNNGLIGIIDPTVLTSDSYLLWIYITQGSNTASFFFPYSIESNLQLGEFSISATDLTVPLTGISIDISRQYRSTDVSAGDFGNGWKLKLPGRVVDTAPEVVNGEPNVLPFNGATKVYVTRPDGKRVGFTFAPYRLSPFLPFIMPAFRPDPGVNDVLEVDQTVLFQVGGEFYELFDVFNPTRYYLTTRDRIRYTIDEVNGLEQVKDSNFNTLTFKPNAIEHSSGVSIAIVRDGAKRITKITDPSAKDILYEYAANGDLLSVTNQLGERTRYTYDSNHRLLTVIDPAGNIVLTNFYDSSGRLFRQLDAFGKEILIDVSVNDRTEKIRDRRGFETLYQYDENGNTIRKRDALGRETLFGYDSNYNLTSEIDPLGARTDYEYNSRSLLLKKTLPADANGVRGVIEYQYNALDQVTREKTAQGFIIEKSYDARGNLLNERDPLGYASAYLYDSNGSLTSFVNKNGATSLYSYDSLGRIISGTDPVSSVSSFTYDDKGNMRSQRKTRTTSSGVRAVESLISYDDNSRPTQMTDAEGKVMRISYDSRGNQVRVEDKNGNAKLTEYDVAGRKTKTTYPDATFELFGYDDEGNLTSQTDRESRVTRFEYDELGRQTKVINPDFSFRITEYDEAGRITSETNERGHSTTYQYDLLGRRTKIIDALGFIEEHEYDLDGREVAVIDGQGKRTVYVYDAVGQKIKSIFPDGSETRSVFDGEGKEIRKVDQAGNVTVYEYDLAGRLIKVTDALNNITTYGYDEVGNKISQTDAQGRMTLFEYDNVGRVVKKILPLGFFETMSYDAQGNKVQHRDFNGNTTQFFFDTNNRLIKQRYPDTSEVLFSYFAEGQRKDFTDSHGTTLYQYDLQNRLKEVTNPDGTFIRYGYDVAGNRTSVTTPSGSTLYEFDALSRNTKITDPQNFSTLFTYSPIGNEIRVQYPNGLVTEKTYDDLYRVTRLETKQGSSIVESFEYGLDAVGNRISVIEQSGRGVAYQYDNIYRLISEQISEPGQAQRVITYSYDKSGNRLVKNDSVSGVTNYTYDANDRLITENGKTYSYDANGNTLVESAPEPVTYQWDAEDRLVSVSKNGVTSTSVYDPDDTRIESSLNGTVTKYLVDKNRNYAEVLEERDALSNVLAAYIHGADLISQNASGVLSYIHGDALGSTRALSNQTGTVTDKISYESFGEIANRTGSTETKYLFTGEQRDPHSGNYFLRARWMKPQVGRFLSRDSLSPLDTDANERNAFIYSQNNPILRIDPSGHSSFAEYAGTLRPALITIPAIEVTRDIVTLLAFGVIVGDCAVDYTVSSLPYPLTLGVGPSGGLCKRKPHRGRIQVQGRDIAATYGKSELSWPWALQVPLPSSAGFAALVSLESVLNTSQLRRRDQAFPKAHDFVSRCASSGGCSVIKKTFQNRPVPKDYPDARVDIEIQAGIAFTP